jgi:uncharacterized protein (TIGR00661 family)
MSNQKPRILVCPLNWGLGHATRSIPIINELLKNGVEVIIGANGSSAALLKSEFPNLVHLSAPELTIKYSRSKFLFPLFMAIQFLKFKNLFTEEKKWLEKTIADNRIDGVVSDNRYGLNSSTIPAVLITHQLNIKTGFFSWVDAVVNKKILLPLLNRFSTIWIPDNENGFSLAGELSHPRYKPTALLHYLGLVNRFSNKFVDTAEAKKILILISGPEPQRTILENKILAGLHFIDEEIVVVRGLPASTEKIKNFNRVRLYNHLPAEELAKEIEQAEIIIARSGYSTLLEILPLSKKSILIPTPGQTEQEYLANKLFNEKRALFVKQKDFNLNEALKKAREFPYETPRLETNQQLSKTVENWIRNNF